MQDHNFEEQVQRKLEEMQLHPSEAVWIKVEEQINRKSKRRRWLLWLPLLLCMGLGGYLLLDTPPVFPGTADVNKVNTPVNQSLPQVKQPAPAISPVKDLPTNDQQESRQKDIVVNHDKDQTAANPVTAGKLRTAFRQKDTPVFTGVQIAQKHDRKKQAGISSTTQSSLPLPETNRNAAHVYSQESAINREQVNDPVNSRSADGYASSNDTAFYLQPALHPAAIHAEPASVSLINTAGIALGSGSPFRITAGKVRPIRTSEWTLNLAYGKSGLSNSIVPKGLSAQDVYSTPGFVGNGAIVNPPPSAIRAGKGFSAGIMARRQLTNRLSWSAGIQYSLFTTYLTTGIKVDSQVMVRQSNALDSRLVQGYYRTGYQGRYTNKVHYIELPVQLHTRLTPVRSFPLFWNAGFIVSRVVGSNALQYNPSAQVYYQDNSLFKRTQLQFTTGFDARLLSGKRFPVQVGPEFRYGLSSQYNAGSGIDKHLYFLSMKAGIMLH